LKLRRETQEVPLLALTVARGGPKMKPHQEGTCAPRGGGPAAPPPPGKVFCKLIGGVVSPTSKLRVLEAEGLTVEQFIQGFMLSVIYQTGKPIIDKTGLTGKFDYRVEFGFTPRDVKVFSQSTGRPESDFETSPQFIDAVQEQLGLKLENTKGPWEHLVIDHVERPSPN